MLNYISGMVEKTQSAISILQQCQAEVANVRNAEEIVAEVQAKANMVSLEVKQAALEEIKITQMCCFRLVGNVGVQLPRPVPGVAWQDIAVLSANTRTGKTT